MVTFYSNENFPRPAVNALKELGYDVVTSVESGNANRGIPDQDVLTYATKNAWAVLTMNRKDFIKLHDDNSNHHGIVVCHADPDFPRLAQRIHATIQGMNSLERQLVRIHRD
ncbi:MAG: DUF5615 family PIN-like protein [Magnetococcales bacterium]|nr:DUF5615 family PIN-like protein [Magnetococcales bacterium]